MTDPKNSENQSEELSLDELEGVAGGGVCFEDRIGESDEDVNDTCFKLKQSLSGTAGPGGSTFLKSNLGGSANPGGDDI